MPQISPFLAALAGNPRVQSRGEILHLLSAIAIGYDESYLPSGVDIAEWRRSAEKMRTAVPDEELRRLEEWVAAAVSEGDRRVRQMHLAGYDPDQSLRHADAEHGAYDAVRATVPLLRDLLGNPDLRFPPLHGHLR